MCQFTNTPASPAVNLNSYPEFPVVSHNLYGLYDNIQDINISVSNLGRNDSRGT